MRLPGCLLPRSLLPDDDALRRVTGVGGDVALEGAWLVAFEMKAAELLQALSQTHEEALYGRAIALLPGAQSYALTVTYVERAGFHFVPDNPVVLVAAPVQVRVA